jgi:hypothetical protein
VRRLRLEFEDSLVNDSMARGSLDKCWFETKPNTKTIADLAVSIYSVSGALHVASLSFLHSNINTTCRSSHYQTPWSICLVTLSSRMEASLCLTAATSPCCMMATTSKSSWQHQDENSPPRLLLPPPACRQLIQPAQTTGPTIQGTDGTSTLPPPPSFTRRTGEGWSLPHSTCPRRGWMQ